MSFKQALRNKDFAVAAELPLSPESGRDSIIKNAGILGDTVDGLLLTDNLYGQPHVSPSFAAAILKSEGFSPVLQLSCRNRNRIALIGELLGARAIGIDSLMLVRGGVLPEGYNPRPRAVLDIEVEELMATARLINEDENLGPMTDILLGAAATIHDPTPDWNPDGLTAKADAGAHFVVTQICFDINLLRRYVEFLVSKQLLRRLNIVVSTTVLESAEQATWLRDNRHPAVVSPDMIERLRDADDPVEEGIRMSSKLAREIASIDGVSGLNFTLGSELSSIPRVLAEAGIAGNWRESR